MFSPDKKTFSPHATVAVEVYILVQECRSSHDQTGTDREGWGIKKFDTNHGNNGNNLLGNTDLRFYLYGWQLSILMDLISVSFVTGLTVTRQLGLEQWSNVLTEGGGTMETC